ncbi:flagellar basal body rod modification protein [Citrobacter braakii]|nr:flagellar basal body rod modification protein [Citrobacter braakii]
MSIAVKMNDPSTTGVNDATGKSSLTGSNAADLQSSFLTLLVAQLKNQDPTNPLQNNELTTQLAQISTVSGIEKTEHHAGIDLRADRQQSVAAGQYADWPRCHDPRYHHPDR